MESLSQLSFKDMFVKPKLTTSAQALFFLVSAIFLFPALLSTPANAFGFYSSANTNNLLCLNKFNELRSAEGIAVPSGNFIVDKINGKQIRLISVNSVNGLDYGSDNCTFYILVQDFTLKNTSFRPFYSNNSNIYADLYIDNYAWNVLLDLKNNQQSDSPDIVSLVPEHINLEIHNSLNFAYNIFKPALALYNKFNKIAGKSGQISIREMFPDTDGDNVVDFFNGTQNDQCILNDGSEVELHRYSCDGNEVDLDDISFYQGFIHGCGYFDSDRNNHFEKGTIYLEEISQESGTVGSFMGHFFGQLPKRISRCKKVAEDKCLNNNTLVEYYVKNGVIKNETVTCKQGCSNGKCICMDYDAISNIADSYLAGINIEKKQVYTPTDFLNDQGTTLSDECINDTTIKEYTTKIIGNKCVVRPVNITCRNGCFNDMCYFMGAFSLIDENNESISKYIPESKRNTRMKICFNSYRNISYSMSAFGLPIGKNQYEFIFRKDCSGKGKCCSRLFNISNFNMLKYSANNIQEKIYIGNCSDNVKNSDETGIDCGGRCPSCATRCNHIPAYAPNDTGCIEFSSEPYGNPLDMCKTLDVCNPSIDWPVKLAADCCNGYIKNDSICSWARQNSLAGGKKACIGLFIIKATSERFMPEYKKIEEAYVPVAGVLNKYHYGVCRNYAAAIYSLLRKAGYTRNEVGFMCDGTHCFGVVKIPGYSKYHIYDGVAPGGIQLFSLPSNYSYCTLISPESYCSYGIPYQELSGKSSRDYNTAAADYLSSHNITVKDYKGNPCNCTADSECRSLGYKRVMLMQFINSKIPSSGDYIPGEKPATLPLPDEIYGCSGLVS